MELPEHQLALPFTGEIHVPKPTLAEKYTNKSLPEQKLETAVAMEHRKIIQFIDRIISTLAPSTDIQDKANALRIKAHLMSARELIEAISNLGINFKKFDLSESERIAFDRTYEAYKPFKGISKTESEDIA